MSRFSSTIPILSIDSRQASSGVGTVLLRLLDVVRETSDREEEAMLSVMIRFATDENARQAVDRAFALFPMELKCLKKQREPE